MYTEQEKADLYKTVVDSIRRVNGILTKWVAEANLPESKLKFGITDVRGLVKDQVLRSFRNHGSAQMLNRVLSKAYLYIDADMVKGSIRGLRLGELERYDSYHGEAGVMREILNKVPYNTLVPYEYETIGTIKVSNEFNPHFNVSFEALESISFQTV